MYGPSSADDAAIRRDILSSFLPTVSPSLHAVYGRAYGTSSA
jgi:hypothetical protein